MRFKGVDLKTGEFVYGNYFVEVPLKLTYSVRYELDLLEKYNVTHVAVLTDSTTNKSHYVDMKTLQEKVKHITEHGAETIIYTNDLIYNVKTAKTFVVLYNYIEGRAEVRDLNSGEIFELHHLTNKTTLTEDISDLLILDARPVGAYVKSTVFTSTKLFKYKDTICDSFEYVKYVEDLVLKLYKDGKTVDVVKNFNEDSIKPLILKIFIEGEEVDLFDCDMIMVKLNNDSDYFTPCMVKYNFYSGEVYVKDGILDDFNNKRTVITIEDIKDKPKKLKQPIN